MEISKRDQEIIEGLNQGQTGSALATKFGVSSSLISVIKKKYQHLLTNSTSTTKESIKTVRESVKSVEQSPKKAIERTVNVIQQTGKAVQFKTTASTVQQLFKEIKGIISLDGLDAFLNANNKSILLTDFDTSELPSVIALFIISVPQKVKAG